MNGSWRRCYQDRCTKESRRLPVASREATNPSRHVNTIAIHIV
jgi:hypothetical protein